MIKTGEMFCPVPIRPEDLMTEEEVAGRLRVSIYTMARLRKSGRGPAWVKVGTRVRYIRSVVEDWEKANSKNEIWKKWSRAK